MDRSRAHDRLVSFAMSLMLTSAFLASAPAGFVAAGAGPQPSAVMGALEGLRAAGFSGVQNVELPAPASAPAPQTAPAAHVAGSPVLTPAQLQKIKDLTAAHGHPITLSQQTTDALGLTRGGTTITTPQLSMKDTEGVRHTIQPVDGGYVLMIRRVDTSLDAIRADADQKLVAAITGDNASDTVAVIPVAKAQQELEAEISFWIDVTGRF